MIVKSRIIINVFLSLLSLSAVLPLARCIGHQQRGAAEPLGRAGAGAVRRRAPCSGRERGGCSGGGSSSGERRGHQTRHPVGGEGGHQAAAAMKLKQRVVLLCAVLLLLGLAKVSSQ